MTTGGYLSGHEYGSGRIIQEIYPNLYERDLLSKVVKSHTYSRRLKCYINAIHFTIRDTPARFWADCETVHGRTIYPWCGL